MVDKKKREHKPLPKVKQSKSETSDGPVNIFESSDEDDDVQTSPLPLVINRFDESSTCKTSDSLDEMFSQINERARTPTLAEELYPYLNRDYWNHPKVKKLGFLFKFHFHYNVGRGCDEIAIRKDNSGTNASLFAWKASDTPQFMKETLKPLEKMCSRLSTAELLEGVEPKYWDGNNERFFAKGITKTSPGGEIKIRPYIDRKNPSVPLIRWFMEIPSVLTLKSRGQMDDDGKEWNGYRMKNTLEQYRLVIYKIQQIYDSYLEQKKEQDRSSDQDDCDDQF